jgi:phosphohistidine phosphatase SixA
MRGPLQLLAIGIALLAIAPARADEVAWAALRQPATVLIVRHAETEPGVGDPPGFRLAECGTQRNLSPAGRAQAAAMGQRLAEQGVTVARVESSRWCRCAETARLAFPTQQVVVDESLNSFFEDRSAATAQTRALRARIAAWTGPGVLVLVTHQVNISALTGRPTATGEGIVLRSAGGDVEVLGSVRF